MPERPGVTVAGRMTGSSDTRRQRTAKVSITEIIRVDHIQKFEHVLKTVLDELRDQRAPIADSSRYYPMIFSI